MVGGRGGVPTCRLWNVAPAKHCSHVAWWGQQDGEGGRSLPHEGGGRSSSASCPPPPTPHRLGAPVHPAGGAPRTMSTPTTKKQQMARLFFCFPASTASALPLPARPADQPHHRCAAQGAAPHATHRDGGVVARRRVTGRRPARPPTVPSLVPPTAGRPAVGVDSVGRPPHTPPHKPPHAGTRPLSPPHPPSTREATRPPPHAPPVLVFEPS